MLKKLHKPVNRNPRRPQRQTKALEMLEARTLYSIIELGAITELINLRNENIELQFHANGSTTVLDNGFLEGTTTGRTFNLRGLGGVNSVMLDDVSGADSVSISYNAESRMQAKIGSDTVVFQNTLFSSKTLMMPAGGDDSVAIGGGAIGVAGINRWNVIGGGSATALDITDINEIYASYTVQSNSVDWGNTVGVNYSNIGALQLVGTAGNATYDVQSTSVPTYIYGTGTGTDVFTVGAGNLGLLQGPVSVTGSSVSSLTIDDKSADFTGAYTLDGNSAKRSGFGGLTYNQMQSVDLFGSSDATVYNVQSPSSDTTINIGNGNLNSEPSGGVTVSGNANVVLDDHLSDSNAAYTIGSNAVRRLGFGGLTYNKVQSLTIYGASGGNTYTVGGTSATTTLLGGAGTNTFYIGTGNLSLLSGAVTVVGGGASNDTMIINDEFSSVSYTYTVTSDSVTRGGFGGLLYSGVNELVLYGSSGNDDYLVNSSSITTLLNAGNGNDRFLIANGPGTLANMKGKVIVNGGGGENYLIFCTAQPITENEFTLAPAAGGGESITGPSGFGGLEYYHVNFSY